MRCEFRTHHVATTINDVEYARRHASLVQSLGKNLCLDGAHLAGLDDEGAAGRESGGELAADGTDIAVPRADGGDDTHRLQSDFRSADGLREFESLDRLGHVEKEIGGVGR